MDRKTIKSILLKSTLIYFILAGVCHSDYIINIDAVESGWVSSNGMSNSGSGTNYVAGRLESNGLTYINYFVFDLSGVEGPVKAAILKLQNPANGFYSFRNDYFGLSDYYTYSFTGIYGTHLNSSDLLQDNWHNISTGVAVINIAYNASFGDVEVNETSNGTVVEIPFNSTGLDNLNSFIDSMSSDPYYALTGSLLSTSAAELHVFAYTGYNLYSRVLSLEIEELPIRIDGLTPKYYSSLQAAYDDSRDGDTIRTQAVRFNEDLYIDLNKSVIFVGGYDNNFINTIDKTRLGGNLIISNGATVIENFELEF